MDIVLCTECGKLMKRYVTVCDRCTRTNLEYFKDAHSPRLRVRLKQVTGRDGHVSPIYSSAMVIVIAVAVTAAAYQFNLKDKPAMQRTLRAAAVSNVVAR